MREGWTIKLGTLSDNERFIRESAHESSAVDRLRAVEMLRRMYDQPELPPDFKEFLSCLTSRGVRFVIVGAHALAAAGLARPTRDIDVLVEPTKAFDQHLRRRRALSLNDAPAGWRARDMVRSRRRA